MTTQPRQITPLAFPVECVIAFLVLLFSSPLYSATDVQRVPALRFDNGVYVSLNALPNAALYRSPQKHKIELRIGNRPIVFTRLSSVMAINGEIFRLPIALRDYDNQVYIPETAVILIAQQLNIPITIDIAPAPLAARTQSVPRITEEPPLPKVEIVQPKDDWALNTVIVDPGHGGKDPGAIGHRGTREKAIVLDVAQRLKTQLEKHLGINVILTRDDDTFIPLGTRSKMAIQQDGKIFVSLHCNATKNRDAEGIEVYFLSEAKTKNAADVARAENSVLEKYEGITPDSSNTYLDRIASGLLSTQFLKESQTLAADLHNAVTGHISQTKPRGVKQANFYVMRGTMGRMPSVLVELGFVTNRNEEKQLKSSHHQQKLADALYEGIKIFKHRYEQQLSAGN